MRILIVEDDIKTADFIRRGLEEEDFVVNSVKSGEACLQIIKADNYDLVILDIGLPDIDGFEVCRILRERQVNIPVLMLTGRGDVKDRVTGLKTGADDYLIKPFFFDELLARVQALLRRERFAFKEVLQAGSLVMDTTSKKVTINKKQLELTYTEYDVLEYLMRHPGEVIQRSLLEQHVWNQEFVSSSNVVDVFIKRIREKIGENGKNIIQTVYGKGYRLLTK